MSGLGHAYFGATGAGVGWWIAMRIVTLVSLALASRVSGAAPMIVVVALIFAVPVAVGTDAWCVARRVATAPVTDHGSRTLRAIAFLAVGTLAAFVARKATVRFVAEAYRIPSSSMEPTILVGDWLYVVPADSTSARPGALVAYREEGDTLLKRVVALAGETIEMRKGQLLRNGAAVAEPYARNDSEPDYGGSVFGWQGNFLADPSRRGGYQPTRDTWGPLVVPPRSLFVLGDNRHNSKDSRFASFVPVSDVVGRPTNIYFSRDPDSGEMRWNRVGLAVR